MASIDRIQALSEEIKKKRKDPNHEINMSEIRINDLANEIKSGNKNALFEMNNPKIQNKNNTASNSKLLNQFLNSLANPETSKTTGSTKSNNDLLNQLMKPLGINKGGGGTTGGTGTSRSFGSNEVSTDNIANNVTGGGGGSTAGTGTSRSFEEDPKWYQQILKKSEAFDDGYQFGDVSKTFGYSVADAELGILNGIVKFGEDISDTILGVEADIKEKQGDYEGALEIRSNLADGSSHSISESISKFQKGLDKYSVIGDTGDQVTEGVGHMASIWAIGEAVGGVAGKAAGGAEGATAVANADKIAKATEIGTKIGESSAIFTSSTGNSLSESYQKYGAEGISSQQAWEKALTSAGIETFTENLFGMFGNADTKLVNKLSGVAKTGLGKALIRAGSSAAGEGAEEIISYSLNYVADRALDAKNKGEGVQFSEEWNSEEMWEQAGIAALTALTMSGGSTVNSVNEVKSKNPGMTTNQALDVVGVTEDMKAMSEDLESEIKKLEKKLEKTTDEETTNQLKEELDLKKKQLDVLQNDPEMVTRMVEAMADRKQEVHDKLVAVNAWDMNNTENNQENQQDIAPVQEENTQDIAPVQEQINTIEAQQTKIDEDNKAKQAEQEARTQLFTSKTADTDSIYRQKIVESAQRLGINNTKASHSVVDLMSKLSEETGTQYEFTNNKELSTKLKELQANGSEATGINGFKDGGRVLINIDSPNALSAIIGHETNHLLTGTQEYTNYQNTVIEYLKETGQYDDLRAKMEKIYQGTDTNIDEEIASDKAGELFSDEAFVSQLSVQQPNVFQKIYNYIKHLYKTATAGSKEARAIEKMKYAFDKAYNAQLKNSNTKTEYSLAGPNANTANYSTLAKAIDLEKTLSPEEIWKKTGWYRGNENLWRFEINDENIKVSTKGFAPNIQYKLTDVLQNADELFNAYPRLKNARVVFSNKLDDSIAGGFSTETNSDNYIFNIKNLQNENEFKKTVLHEVQHNIQKIEGFSTGSDSQSWGNIKNKLREKYNKIDTDIEYINSKIGLKKYQEQLLQEGKFGTDEYWKLISDFQNNSIYGKQIERLKTQQEEISNTLKNINNRTNEELYENTAGEQEARDVENRSILSENERKYIMPFVKNEKTVYNIKNKLKYKLNGIEYEMFLKEDINNGRNDFNNTFRYDTESTRQSKYNSTSKTNGNSEYTNRKIEGTSNKQQVQQRGSNEIAPSIKNTDIKYSLSQDNQGRTLTKEQQEYFNDSKARERDGSLTTVYSGTENGGFTQFYGYSYFTNSKDVARSYSGSIESITKTTLENGSKNNIGNYEGYVNLVNPFEIDLNGSSWDEINIDNIKIDNINELLKKYGISTYEKNGKKYIGTDDIVSIVDGLNEDGVSSYDGIILKNIYDNGKRANVNDTLANDYIIFNPNQFKSVDNTNPTSNPDIRYSLSGLEQYEDNKKQASKDIAPAKGITGKDIKLQDNIAPVANKETIRYNNVIESEVNNNGEQIPRENGSIQETTNEQMGRGDTEVYSRIKELYRDIKREVATERTKLNDLVTEELNQFPISKTKSQKFIRDLANNRMMTQDEIYSFLNDNNTFKAKEVNEYVKQIRSDINRYEFNLSDNVRNELKYNYGNIPRNIKISNNGLEVDQIYQELSNKYPDIFSPDIINPGEQAIQIIDFMKENKPVSTIETEVNSPEEISNISNLIYEYKQVYDEAKNYYDQLFLDGKRQLQNEAKNELNSNKKITRKEVRQKLLEEMDITADEISKGNDIKSLNFQLTDPIRVNEKVFGRELGEKINNATINKTKHNTAEKIRWQNQQRAEIKELGIKARSKESAAVQKYGEGEWVNKNGETLKYGDAELAKEFSDISTQNKIKNAAKVIRGKYDTYIDQINNVLTSLGYDAIPKRADYMRHFQELGDVFSKTGVPFNLNDMNAEELPTDINGLTEFNKPGKNWFASAQQRYGNKTTYDAITGIDGYLEGAGNLIYHTGDIQNYRALSQLIRDTFGATKGFDNLDGLSNAQIEQRIADIQKNKLSRYAAWLDEQANSLAGKKGAIDRGVERALGRKGYTFLNTLKSQVGSNMTGFNVRSSLTNFISSTIAAAKTNKIAMVKGTVSTINNMFHNDGFIDKSDFLTTRFGSDSLSQKVWQKVSNAGQIFMTGSDYFTSNVITRSKYFEGLQKGMTEAEAIEYADDFASRVMGDRSQGATAEAFNSKTLGLFTQFQLEVNNQWQYMVHDTKMDFQKNSNINGGLKAGATALFQMGQLAAYSYLFNELFEKLTGSRAAFDPIEIIKKIFGLDDDDKDKTTDQRIAEAGEMLVDNIPFGNLFTGGGRIPISEAFTGLSTLTGKLTNQKDEYGNDIEWADVGNDLKEAAPYWILPTGYSQLKKSIQGAKLYDDDLPIAGSYTDSGNLRFTVDEDNASKVKSFLFGQWSNNEAQKYIESGYKTINSKNIKELKDLNMSSSEYREYRNGLSDKKSNEEKMKYINDLPVSDSKKKIMASNAIGKDIDMKEYNKYGSYEEFDYANKNPEKYKFLKDNNVSYSKYKNNKEEYDYAYKNPDKYNTIKAITNYSDYQKYSKDIEKIEADKNSNGKSISGSRKTKVINYINSLDLSIPQKAMLIRTEYSTFDDYNEEIIQYVDKLDLTYNEKVSILEGLKMKVASDGSISW